MHINFFTVKRAKEDYLHATLESLSESDGKDLHVTLFMGSEDESYVNRYRNDPRISIIPWTLGSLEVGKSVNQNHARAIKASSPDGHFVFEDDVEFCKNWLEVALQAIRELEQTGKRIYVLSLYACYTLPAAGKFYRAYPSELFYGSQGLYIPEGVGREVAEYVLDPERITQHFSDLLIARWAGENGDCLWATRHSVIQHIGCFGACANGASFHQAADYPGNV